MIIENLTILDYSLLAALLVLFVSQVYWYSRYMAAPARRMRKDKSRETRDESRELSEAPGVSVVLCAHNEQENLSQYLQALLTQDWPEYEVIVVDDGSEDETRAVIERFMVHDPRLHMTFVPYGARVGSTKKLALTLAAKASQYEYLLLTDADCVPESNHWIREMMGGFRGNTDRNTSIVLGFSPYFKEEGHVNRLVRYDTLFNGLHYLGSALCGYPYMGVGRNLAYKKSLFFESGGFTQLMNNNAGDDDLFVNHVATKDNTAVVLSRESYVWSLAKKTLKEWWLQKRRHVSVSPLYRTETKFRLALEPLTRGLFYAVWLYAMWFYRPTDLQISVPNGLFLLTIVLFITRWIVQTAIINTSARRMGLRRFSMFSVQWFDIVLPLVNLWMLIVPKRESKW